MMMMSKLIAVLALIAVFVAIVDGYSVSGNTILGPDGKPILLRGIDRCSLEWSTAGEGLGINDYRIMANWSANIVRLSLNQCFWLANKDSYQTVVDTQVKNIKSLNMGVILDLHWSNKGNSAVTCDQQNMPDANSATFWTQVATKYANDAWVAFELYNEPRDVSWSVWRNGGDAGGFQTPGFQSLYNTVRATGAKNLVLIAGLNWAYDLSGVPANAITGTNIGYSSHPYDFAGKQPSDWPSGFGFLAATYPVVLTEFGNYNCDPAYYNSIIAYADAHSISWTAWAWYVSGCGFPSVITDWSGTPSAVGAVIQKSLRTSSKVPSSGTASSATSTTAKTSTTTTGSTTGKTTTTTTGSGSTTGSSGTKITVNVNNGTNKYWIAIDSFSGALYATNSVQFKDSAAGAGWVTGTKETWGGFSWGANRLIVAPISLTLTATNGHTAVLTNVITSVAVGAYPSSSQYN